MDLNGFDGKIVSITTIDGVVFEGECLHNSDEYCEHEFGRNESSLQIDDFLFFESDIERVDVIEEKEIYIWDDRPEHLMKLDRKPFTMIEEGTKTIELRLYDEKRQKINVGDIIRFENDQMEETLRVIVEDLYIFDDFRQLYEELPLLECGYTEENIDTADPKDMNEYYPPERQAMYKVVGIKVKLY